MKLGGQWQVVIAKPHRTPTRGNTHIADWRRPLFALCGVGVIDYRDTPIPDRPYDAPAAATCRRCRHAFRQMSEDTLPAALRVPGSRRRQTRRPRRQVPLSPTVDQLSLFDPNALGTP